jgi:hypothetical protein
MTMLGILLVSSAITTLPHNPVRVDFMDKPQPKTTQTPHGQKARPRGCVRRKRGNRLRQRQRT